MQLGTSFVNFLRPTPTADELLTLLGPREPGTELAIGISFFIGTPPENDQYALPVEGSYGFRSDRRINVIYNENKYPTLCKRAEALKEPSK